MPRHGIPLCLLLASLSYAQDGLPLPPPIGGDPPPALERAEQRRLGPTLEQLTEQRALSATHQVSVRWDMASGAPGSVEFSPALALEASQPEAAAREALSRLGALYGQQRPLELTVLELTVLQGAATVRLGQRLGESWVDGAEVRVLLERSARGVALRAVHGRLFRDLPTSLPAMDPGTSEPEIAWGELKLVGAEPRLIATFLPDGVWKSARQRIELVEALPVLVLRDAEGSELSRRPLGLGAGHARGKVFPVDPNQGAKSVPIGGLLLHDAQEGRRFAADGSGRFSGRRAGLPWGFWGRRDRVLAQAASYPVAEGGDLTLDFTGQDPRLDELNVYYHLVETRAFFSRYADIPQVAKALESKIVATVNTHHTNALAVVAAAELHGQRYDHPLFFGTLYDSASRDASVVTHERVHALLFDMGLLGGGDGSALHEGLADYFAAVRLGSPHVGAFSMGPMARDISELRVYPEHEGEAHQTGVIVSGALWDARRELGEVADRLALLAVTRLGSSPKLLDYRDALLAAEQDTYHGAHAAVLRRHLTRHGLLTRDGETNRPPAIVVRFQEGQADVAPIASLLVAGEAVEHRLRLEAKGERRVLRVRARDPEGRPVVIGLDGLEPLRAGGLRMAQVGDSAMLEVALRDELPAGMHRLTITAQDAEGELAARTYTLFVVPDLEEPDRLVQALVRAEPGVQKRVPLSALIFKDGEDPRAAGVRVRIAGPRVAQARIEGGELVLDPTEGDRGLHNVMLLVRRTRWQGERIVDVALAVGGGPYIDVLARVPATSQEGTKRSRILARVTPDQVVTVQAGQALQLAAQAWAELPDPERKATPPVSLEIERASEGLGVVGAPVYQRIMPASAHPLTWSSGIFSAFFESVEVADQHLALYISPERGRGVVRGQVVLVARSGERVSRRVVNVIVLPPSDDHAPTIAGPATLELDARGQASVDLTASDPEGDDVTLELLYPTAKGDPRGGFGATLPPEVEGKSTLSGLARAIGLDPQAGTRRVTNRGTLTIHASKPVTAVILARDAHGNQSVHTIQVGPAAAGAGGQGLVDRLREAGR